MLSLFTPSVSIENLGKPWANLQMEERTQEAKYIERWPNTTSALAGWSRFDIPLDRYGGVHSQLICTSITLGSSTCHQASQQGNTYWAKYQKADRASTLVTLWNGPWRSGSRERTEVKFSGFSPLGCKWEKRGVFFICSSSYNIPWFRSTCSPKNFFVNCEFFFIMTDCYETWGNDASPPCYSFVRTGSQT
jgi:hypothetical protein